EAEPVDPGVGDRIWYDFSTFVDLLILVNRREELIAHDTAGLRDLNEVLQDASTFNPSAFASMFGFDPELDELFDDGIRHPEPWRNRVRTLLSKSTAEFG
ncbi:MAG: hypothetical protein AAFX94_07815, partial [Myxococcota bacterium]